jgi:putative molybdopterin biosynthesis protein
LAANPEYLTTRELAELLRVKERKVYELAASGDLPCSRATGKLLFPRGEVEAWLDRHRSGAPAVERKSRPNIFVGSHDPLLEWILRESGSGLAAFMDGSLDGLRRLQQGEAIAGGMHVVEDDEQYNVQHVRSTLKDDPVVLIEFAWREQGLIVAQGNPLHISGLKDLTGRRFMPRQREAGTWVLLGELLAREDISIEALELVSPPARTQTDVAAAVADDKADAGLGLASMAKRFRLDFVPLTRERFDIVVYRRAYFEAPFQRLMAFCRSPMFAAKAEELGGYDISGFGTVRYNGP